MDRMCLDSCHATHGPLLSRDPPQPVPATPVGAVRAVRIARCLPIGAARGGEQPSDRTGVLSRVAWRRTAVRTSGTLAGALTLVLALIQGGCAKGTSARTAGSAAHPPDGAADGRL